MNNKLCAGILAGATAAYVARRIGTRWGATDDEVHRGLPGDEIVPHPMVETTHAITVHAAASDIWPWLVQMGVRRGGWYTGSWYRLIDRYVWRTQIPVAEMVMPALQEVHAGDVIPDGPPGTAYFTVSRVEPERVLALHSTTHIRYMVPRALRENARASIWGEFSWVFVLREENPATCRVILRTRASYGPIWFRALTAQFLVLADGPMARLMLRTIQQRVERSVHPTHTTPIEPDKQPASIG